MLDRLEGFGRFVDFALRAILAIPRAAIARPLACARQFERVAWGSLPIVMVAGLSVGLVTWLQMRRLLVVWAAQETLPSVLAVAVLVETGPILASLLVAGRLGAGLAAELGSMTLTEEIDAREVLGAPTISTLVAPRAIACMIAVPLLTVLMDTFALMGGLIAEMTAGSLSVRAYNTRSLDFLWLRDIVPSTLKTAVFGLLIGLVGCWTGLHADRSTEAVGHAATRGVVRSMLAVFAANIVLVPLIQGLVDRIGWAG
ncbi:MAG: ABC-type transport system involved in resistance to organic solvent, permease component [Planctomycetota bacterium]|nr:ABC-type transport system involved in resistance to organic solvent, permease component [Planctomycetota bacterium]